MRKDVKIGLGIGGVLLAVLIVYLLVPKTNDNAEFARTNETSTSPGESNGPGPRETASGEPIDAPAQTGAQGGVQVPDQGTGQQTAAQDPGSEGASRDTPVANVDWEQVLATGMIPESARIGLMAQNPIAQDAPEDIFADKGPGGPKPGANEIVNWNSGAGQSPTAIQTPAAKPAAPAVATGQAPAAAKGGLKDHVIQQGENLSMIASVAYGDARMYREILKANPNLDERKLKPGMVIKMPDASTFAAPKAQQAAAKQEAAVDASTQYRVQQGDSLHKIALKLYGKAAKADALYEANKDKIGDDSSRLKLGMVLKLPEPPAAATSAR